MGRRGTGRIMARTAAAGAFAGSFVPENRTAPIIPVTNAPKTPIKVRYEPSGCGWSE